MSRTRGGMFLAFGVAVFGLSVAALFYAKSIAVIAEGHVSLPWQMVGLIGFPISFALLTRGGRYFAVGAEAAMKADPRPPILYLRSFKDDDAAIDLPKPLLTHDFFVFTPNPRAEEMLVGLNDIGPLVAIGRPGEDLPETGAFRLYVSDAEWKAKVRELMERCRFVLLLGKTTTGGVHWEIGEATANLRPDQLLFFFPRSGDDQEAREAGYSTFKDSVTRYFPVPLPETIGQSNFLRFGEGWRAEWVGDQNDRSPAKFINDIKSLGDDRRSVRAALAAAPLHRKIVGLSIILACFVAFSILIAWAYGEIMALQ